MNVVVGKKNLEPIEISNKELLGTWSGTQQPSQWPHTEVMYEMKEKGLHQVLGYVFLQEHFCPIALCLYLLEYCPDDSFSLRYTFAGDIALLLEDSLFWGHTWWFSRDILVPTLMNDSQKCLEDYMECWGLNTGRHSTHCTIALAPQHIWVLGVMLKHLRSQSNLRCRILKFADLLWDSISKDLCWFWAYVKLLINYTNTFSQNILISLKN